MLQVPSVLTLWLFIVSLCCEAKPRSEELILEEMVKNSYKGSWYPLSNKVLPYEGFKLKDGKLFRDNQDDVPYTGWYTQADRNKTVRMLASFMDGKRQGYFAKWDKAGMLRMRGEYFDGEKDGTHIEINDKGLKISERSYLIGKLHGASTFWYDNGKRKLASTFEYGLIMEAKGWLANGKPCPYTNVTGGSGVIFNFGQGFLEQLLQVPQSQKSVPKDSNQTNVFKFGELTIDQ